MIETHTAEAQRQDTRPLRGMRLPHFIVIGAAKSGTTTLTSYLRRHPQVFISEKKEPCFFDADVAWHRGWDWYASLFDAAGENQFCGEASTNYTRYPQVPDVPRRMFERMPNVRLIYLLRNPVDRAYSHYVHRYTREVYPGRPITMSFEDFVKADPMCLDSSDYLLQIERYLEYFPREALLLLRLDELQRDPAAVVRRVLRFIGADDSVDIADQRVVENDAAEHARNTLRNRIMGPLRRQPLLSMVARSTPQRLKDLVFDTLTRTSRGRDIAESMKPRPMLPQTRAALVERYRSSNEALMSQFGIDTSDWNRP